MDQIRQRVLFTGRVQGVGFRYNALHCAKGVAVTGFVCNLPDGKVELVAEGREQEVEALLADIRDSMADYIVGESAERSDPTGEFKSFSIRH